MNATAPARTLRSQAALRPRSLTLASWPPTTALPSLRTGTGSARALHGDSQTPDHQDQDGSLDPDSVQARMIRALEARYQPPKPSRPVTPSTSQVQASHGSSPAASSTIKCTFSGSQAETSLPTSTPAEAEEAVSRVVASSLLQAEQTGAAEAAVLAQGHTSPDSDKTAAVAKPSPDTVPSRVGQYEGGRFLPKTPDNQPWAAQYVRPTHAGSRPGEEAVPSVYYGRFIKAGGSSGGNMKSISQRLKNLGVNPSTLPLDDAKAMRAVREGIRRFEKAGRVYGARYGALEYRTRKLTEAEAAELQAELEADVEKAQLQAEAEEAEVEAADGQHATTMSRNMPSDATDSSRAPGDGRGRGGGLTMRRWTSIADERIEAARAAGFFKENRLRGKPLEQETHESNPFIGKEEFLMNRLVKRQGASPPWVELNNTFHSHLSSFRAKMMDSLSRRAILNLTQSGSLVSNKGPGTGSSGTAEQRRAYFLSLARSYRDVQWEDREEAYHREAIKDMNETLRRHNSMSPPSARRGMVTLEEELKRCYTESPEIIADGLEEEWAIATGLKPSNGLYSIGGISSKSQTYDVWGNPVSHDAGAKSSSWTFGSLFSRSSAVESGGRVRPGTGSGDRDGPVSNGLGAEDTGSPEDVANLGLLQKLKVWLTSTDSPSQPPRHK